MLFGRSIVLLVLLMIVASSNAVSAVALTIDSDEKQGEYLHVIVSLVNVSDVDDHAGRYQLKIMCVSMNAENRWAGPMLLNVYAYLPSYAEAINLTSFSMLAAANVSGQKSEALRAEVSDVGGFRLVHWVISNFQYAIAREWSFLDRMYYFLCFTVPQNESASAYVSVQAEFYHYYGVFYSRVADEKVHWLHVQSSGQDQTPPETAEIEFPTFLATPLTINLMLAAFMTIFSISLYRNKKRPQAASPKTENSKPEKTLLPKLAVPSFMVQALGFVIFLVGFINIVLGAMNLYGIPSMACSALAYGVAFAAASFGLLLKQAWGWYGAFIASIASLIDHFVLFPNLALITVPVELFILLYLYVCHDAFNI